ncbi:hypothetical protein L210DRAFT_2235973 [Boletus edulis BED1]|uniref:Uncharacterized protein n=1 Tax=Boletus edulis BED1 TaxID=1328754 RepID=A0AAD4GEV8_BOLED|nr:hypothetical protein L210DRAFT_2235973 [Boletus edulis BED1]
MSDLPPYTAVQAPPPRYTLPETFNIGRRNVDLFIQPQQLKGHLSMLHAFHSLRVTIESNDEPRFPRNIREMEPEKRWGWFVSIAVERFERWCRSLGEWCFANLELALPPVDVLMVWHAYLLNPIWYAEDTAHISAVAHLTRLTEYLATNIGYPDLLITISPHPDRVHNWEHRTNTPYDPWDAAAAITTKGIQCPYCEHRMVVPFLDPSGSGYAQSSFVARCVSCGKKFKKDTLGLYKFANDIAGVTGFLSGTLHTPYNQHDTARATLIKKRIIAAAKLPVSGTITTRAFMEKLKFDPAMLTGILNSQIQQRIGRRIMGAYTDDRPFSVELVLRQASFVRKMADLGWTDPDFFDDEGEMVILQHCVARYHAFLALMVDSPGSFFVPTLDIDLAWHTHQLRASHYHTECKQVVGRYIDHDDKVDEDHLATAFDITCRAWTNRYGLPYTYCGCPLPGTTLGQRLRNALSLHRHREEDVLVPPPDAAAGTHASDHNAVYINRKASEHARQRRRQKAERRRRRAALDAKDKDEPKGAPGALIRSNRNETDRGTHELAFFYPIPLYIGVGACVGTPLLIDGGACATVSCRLEALFPLY